MIKAFESSFENFEANVERAYVLFKTLSKEVYTQRRNKQNRSIKQIIGHMIDSASNNTHRIVHLQYRESPLEFPNYATEGNNDKWIAIQNYQDENWELLLNHWKYIHLHILHVINNVEETKFINVWLGGPDEEVTLKEMILDFPSHFHLHISEIDELINQ